MTKNSPNQSNDEALLYALLEETDNFVISEGLKACPSHEYYTWLMLTDFLVFDVALHRFYCDT